MSVDSERDTILLPTRYRIDTDDGYEMLRNGREDFFISNRNFAPIDSFFIHGVSKSIQSLLSAKPDTKVQVLDLAGGTESRAVKDIKEQFGDNVQAVNIDIAHNIQKGQGADRVQGDATRLPIADSSIDVIYSYEFLPFLMRFHSEHALQVKKVLSEITRVLKPGGIAFIYDEEELSRPKSGDKLRELANELGITIETHESIYVKQERYFPKFWKNELRPEKFLVMKKPLNGE